MTHMLCKRTALWVLCFLITAHTTIGADTQLRIGTLSITLPEGATLHKLGEDRYIQLPKASRVFLYPVVDKKDIPDYHLANMNLEGTTEKRYGDAIAMLSLYSSGKNSGAVVLQIPLVRHTLVGTWKTSSGKDMVKSCLDTLQPASSEATPFNQLRQEDGGTPQDNSAEDDEENGEADSSTDVETTAAANAPTSYYLQRLAEEIFPKMATATEDEIHKTITTWTHANKLKEEVGTIYPKNLEYEKLQPVASLYTQVVGKLTPLNREIKRLEDNLYEKVLQKTPCKLCYGKGYKKVGNTHFMCKKCRGKGFFTKQVSEKNKKIDKELSEKKMQQSRLTSAEVQLRSFGKSVISRQLTKTTVDLDNELKPIKKICKRLKKCNIACDL